MLIYTAPEPINSIIIPGVNRQPFCAFTENRPELAKYRYIFKFYIWKEFKSIQNSVGTGLTPPKNQ